MGESGESASEGHCERESEEDKVMDGGDSFENGGREEREGEVGEEEGQREVGEDCESQEKWGRT